MGRAGGRPSSPPSPPPTSARFSASAERTSIRTCSARARAASPPGRRLAVVCPGPCGRPSPSPCPLQSAPPPSSFSSGLCRSAPRPAPARPQRFLWVPLPSSTALVPGSLHTDLITVLLIMCYVQSLLGWKLPEDRHLTSLPPDARHSASPGTG